MLHNLRNPHGWVICSCQNLPGDSCIYLARITKEESIALYRRLGEMNGSELIEQVETKDEL